MNNVKTEKEYKVYTRDFDEIEKAENLEEADEISKLRRNLDQQLINFKDLIIKLANKLQRQLMAKQTVLGTLILRKGYWIVQNYQE